MMCSTIGSLVCLCALVSLLAGAGVLANGHERRTDVHQQLNDTLVQVYGAELAQPWVQQSISLDLAGIPAALTTLNVLTASMDVLTSLMNSMATSGFDQTGASVWTSAVLLQSFMSTDQGQLFVQGRRCVELGTGTGAVSIAAARLGAARIVATDGNDVMVALAELNAHRNLEAAQLARFTAVGYLWGGRTPLLSAVTRRGGSGTDSSGGGGAGEEEEEEEERDFKFQTVLLTDLLYSEAKVEVLLAAVNAVCSAECDVLVAHEQRRGEGSSEFDQTQTEYFRFFEGMRSLGFGVSELIAAGQMTSMLSEYVAQVTGSDLGISTDPEHLAGPPDALKGTPHKIVLTHATRTASSRLSVSVVGPAPVPDEPDGHVRECLSNCEHVHERQACIRMCERVQHLNPSATDVRQPDDEEVADWAEERDDGNDEELEQQQASAEHAGEQLAEELTEAQLKQLAVMIGMERPAIHPHSAAFLSGVAAPAPHQ
jgi:predicted nicotinamide N-methyase